MASIIYAEGHVHVRRNPHVQVAGVVANIGAYVYEDIVPGMKVRKQGIQLGEHGGDLSVLVHVIRRPLPHIRIEVEACVIYRPPFAVGEHLVLVSNF